MVWFFIGMPRQDPKSVMDTVAYAERLMTKFPGGKVLPLICPMVPFLDPGSRFFEHPKEHGYRIFHKTLEDHRRAMVEPLWHKRLNYETEWLSRRELQDVSYDAIGRLVAVKADMGILPKVVANAVIGTIGETKELLAEMELALDRDGVLPSDLKRTVHTYNRKILAYSSDQIVPTHRVFGGRWFDDFTVPQEIIAECLAA
jgi:clorobiocin biosynthesis protein CloN6